MINDIVKIKVNYMDYDRLSKLAYWLINRYWQKKKRVGISTLYYNLSLPFGRRNGRNVIRTAILGITSKAKER